MGAKVNIVRRNRIEVTFEVGAISDEGTSGGGVFDAYSGIRQLQVRQFGTGKPVGLVAALVLVPGAKAASSAAINCGTCGFGDPNMAEAACNRSMTRY